MKLVRMQVENYRKFKNETIKFGDDISVIAGSNNSGKTSLIDLFRTVFDSNKEKMFSSYLPIEIATHLTDNMYSIFLETFEEYSDYNQRMDSLFNYIFSIEEEGNIIEQTIPFTNVQIEVGYEPSEDISLFSNYLYSFEAMSTSLYFMYSLKPDMILFKKYLKQQFNKLDRKYCNLVDPNKEENIEINCNATKKILFEIYCSSLLEHYYFTDETYQYQTLIDEKDFKNLFHFQNIYASRKLDDEDSSKSKSLSRKVIELASFDEEWNEMIETLPDLILDQIITTNLQSIMKETSNRTLESATSEVSRINGIGAATLLLDIDLQENHIKKLIDQIVVSKFELGEFVFSESSQGLGYSNMIFILLQLESYRQSIEKEKVNFFIIEEPESHMHPQMQTVFSKYLKYYYENFNIQGILTTHSNEIIKSISITDLRVIRPISNVESSIYDFSEFTSEIIDSDLKEFYNFFYEIGFSEIVFADMAILYEGDTERLLIKKLVASEMYTDLKYKYIAYIQVGGAYAFKYFELIKFLNIKTLILTDIDYPKEASSIDDILSGYSTNPTLNYFFGADDFEPTIDDLMNWHEQGENIILENRLNIQFQNDRASYSRTLEEAMLSTKLGINTLEKKDRAFWKNLKKDTNLVFSIPNGLNNISIKDIVNCTGKKKIDFMYSVIINNFLLDMVPSYICSGMEWLNNDQ